MQLMIRFIMNQPAQEEYEFEEDSSISGASLTSTGSTAGAKPKQSVKLIELGPRMRLSLVLVENGLFQGDFIFNRQTKEEERDVLNQRRREKKVEKLEVIEAKKEEEKIMPTPRPGFNPFAAKQKGSLAVMEEWKNRRPAPRPGFNPFDGERPRTIVINGKARTNPFA